ncbi:MAG TPA: site-2 protease family protein [Methylomirabilota bacterium]|jgi:membrane-associated protease RseP (regulator of RpoE activity)
MRVWPARRAPAPGAPDDIVLVADLLGRSLAGVLDVQDRHLRAASVIFRGRLLVPAATAIDLLIERFRVLGYEPLMRPGRDDVVIHALPRLRAAERPRVAVNVILFLLTCLSTLVAGAISFASPTFEPFGTRSLVGQLLTGAPFAATLLAILGVHEFGHYFTARYYKASVTLPYFIPAPPLVIFGTFGAIIRMRSQARDRNSLFDIAAAGPIAGLLVTIPAIVVGLQWSVVAPLPPTGAFHLGESLLMRFFVYLAFGTLPPGTDVFLHPIAVAGWAGLLVTALNLFPVGQLDGGRIAYALFGRRHRTVGMAAFACLLTLAVVTWSPNWLVWAALLFFLVGFHHSPPLDDITPLTRGRRLLGFVCLALLVVLLPPVPLQFS